MPNFRDRCNPATRAARYRWQTASRSPTFYFLNPEINSNCTNLELGIAYCVEAVGNIATYSGYSTSGGSSITVPPASFSSVNTAIQTSTPTGYAYTKSLMPTASGTISGCSVYANYNASINAESDCEYIAFAYQITAEELLEWNPSLSSNLSTCNLQNGYSYCVHQTNITSIFFLEAAWMKRMLMYI